MKTLYLLFLTSCISFANTTLQPVSLQLQWLDQFQFAGYYMAKERGYYTNANLDVKILPYQGVSSLSYVTSHKNSYGVGRSSLLIAKANGDKIVLLKSLFQQTPLILMGIKDYGIENFQNIKNKKIMTSEDISNSIAFQSMFSANHLKINKDIVQIRPSFDIQDLIEKKIDLIAAYVSNEPYSLKKLGYEPIVFSPSDYGFEFYDDILFTSEEEVKLHPKRVQAFTKATLAGWTWAFSHIEETANFIHKHYNIQNKSLEALIFEGHALKKLAYIGYTPLGDINKEKLQHMYDIYISMGLCQSQIPLDSFIYTNPTLFKKLSKLFKKYLDTENILKLLLLLFILILSILYWNRLLNKKVEKEIEKRIEKERLLFRQNRLIAMGEMMSNIAHQWRQPINNINLLVLNIQNAYTQNTLSQTYLDEKVHTIEETIEYMSQTIEDFSTYLSPNKEKQYFNIANSIQIAMKLVMPTLKKNHINLFFNETTKYDYYGYKNEFIQILVIILNNAKDALIKDSDNKKKTINIHVEKENQEIKIFIKDNGIGISDTSKNKIFDPYYTTGHKAKGKGLGLYIAKMIISERFLGKIVMHRLKKGTCFELYISITSDKTK